MRYGKLAVALLSALLIALMALCLRAQPSVQAPEEMPLSISVHTDTNTETIRCWQSDDGNWYVFLPSYAEMDRTFFCLPEDTGCTLDGVALSAGMDCSAFLTDTPYVLAWGQEESTLTFVKSGGVASIHINVQSGSMEYIHLEKGNEEQGRMRLYREDGSLNYSGTLSSLQGRGNSSWNAEKKPYSMTLTEEGDLLDMGAAQRWILLAEGHNPVNIRNKIVFDFAREAGLPYTPDCRWVDLYLNGEYAGLYLLTERNEIHPNRVDIPAEGSFLVSLEIRQNLMDQKIAFVPLDSGQALRIRNADMDEQSLKALLQPVENALIAEDGIDPVTGKHWQELIELDSWARKYLIEELFANPDGGAVSQFFYRRSDDPEGKLYAGPVWDYDFAMGGEGFWMRSYKSFFTTNKEYDDMGNWYPWFYELYRKDAFRQTISTVFETEFLPLLQELTETGLQEYADRIAPSAQLDTIRWNIPQNAVQAEVKFIRSFLNRRMEFFTDLLVHDSVYHTVRVHPGRQYSGFFAVKDGDTLPELPSYEEAGGIGWYTMDTDEPFDITQPIHADAQIYVKKPENRLPVIHFAPVAAVMGLLLCLMLLDVYRTRKNGRK